MIGKSNRYGFVCLFLWLLATPVFSMAAATITPSLSVDIILSSNGREHQAVFMAIKKHLELSPGLNVTTTKHTANDYLDLRKNTNVKAALIITIGTVAARVISKSDGDTPVISAFLPKINYKIIWHNKNRIVSGIVIDQPVERFHEFLKIMLNDDDKVGIFLGDRSIDYKKVRRLLRESDLSLVVENVHGQVTAKNITRLLHASDVVLILPDHKTISPQRSKWLLYMAYRENRPVIAYSSSFVKAGALAAIFTTPESIGRQIAQRVLAISHSSLSISSAIQAMDNFYYPEHFTVKTNKQVARYLGVHLPEDKIIKEIIISNIRRAKR